ncbi:outer membrane beta-barrel protein [Chitinophaga polysaccharea]|uniref:outer membrane beta-barrel protein n=1 Tax=Chitinophaga TaxID=79328 RepID=UPI001455C269|nr:MULTISPECIES: outer membrane beta-barrel protein [Chitinophaga]NLR58365.1 outer membrane beta-barrel protein [Chitinophaga polysaccharea]NLU90892.1 outer membrane beta-barrel protein [Chitinophaga sp. Ak27]
MLLASGLYAQDSTGIVKGKVKDSSYNFVLSNATIAVYRLKDSSLLQFCIPNNFGEFSLPKLPLRDTLSIQITHVGYTTYEKTFVIRPDKNPLNLDWIYLHQSSKNIGEVVITAVAPVSMNGDTLEFNPRAFKTEANATAEDLMRRLPGFTIWGDGDITFNGKKITALYVDGKPFMAGNDITVASQNLPKETLDKVQVYQQRDEKNPLDSTLMANLKLKDDKKTGYFGKLSASYGTTQRYAADGMISGFNKKMQISAVGAANNVNKIASSTDGLIHNNSYKGEGNNIDYQPNFTMAGLNRPVTAGLKFQYDFLPDVQYQRSERLNTDYFIDHNNTLIEGNTITKTLLKPDSILIRQSDNSRTNIYTNQKFAAKYQKDTRNYALTIEAQGTIASSHSINKSDDEQKREDAGILSNSTSSEENRLLSKNSTFSTEFTRRNDGGGIALTKPKRVPTGFTIRYTFGIADNEGSGSNRSLFIATPLSGQAVQKAYDRIYGKRNSELKNHTVYVQYPYLKQLIFGKGRLGDIDLKIGGTGDFRDNRYTNEASDLDTLNKAYVQNSYLTGWRRENISNLQPELVVSRLFFKGLTNRYNKYVTINLIARSQYYSLRDNATQVIQNLQYHYNYFIPQASVTYNNHQYGNYQATYDFRFETNVVYPLVNQMAPLIDSTNLWLLPQANPGIRPEYNKRYAISYTFESRRHKNPYSFSISADYTQTDNKMADSSFYDNTGRTLIYTVNVKGGHYWHTTAGYKKAYSPNTYNTFEFTTWYNINRYDNPMYINKAADISTSIAHSIDVQLGYAYRDIIAFKLQQGLSYYNSIQRSSNDAAFCSNNLFTRISGTLRLPQSLSWSSNITYNRSTANRLPAVNYTIWNASLAYRFLPAKQGEVKLSALDLLRQNKGVINTGDKNMQTFGYNNVLQQYFMLSFSYYPRKFGK